MADGFTPTPSSDLALYHADLERRMIPPELAERLGWIFCPNAREISPSYPDVPAIFIPYFDDAGTSLNIPGQRWPMHRIRLLRSPTHDWLKRHEIDPAKPPKYWQPSAPPAVYLTKASATGRTFDWCEIQQDVSQGVLVTEGEIKSGIATLAGYPTLGLGGVDCIYADRGAGILLPQLEAFKWTGRHVYIAFDSDIANNAGVQRAERLLAAELQRRGATVFAVRIPPADNGGKQGLDDFILSNDDTALEALLEAALQVDPTLGEGQTMREWIAELNEKFAVVRHGSDALIATFDKTNGSNAVRVGFMKINAFEALHRNKYPIDASDKDRRHVAKRWLDAPQRREYIGGVEFAPGRETSPDILNLYQGWGVQAAAGDWSLMRDHIRDNICGGDPKAFEYVMGWLASSVRSLDRPLGVALVLRGGQGTGKGILGRAMGHIFGTHSMQLVKSEQAIGRFNAALGDVLFVFGDEAFYAADPRQSGALKSLITEDQIAIEAKFRDPVMRRNTVRLFLATNEEWAVPADVDDRRFAVFDVASLRRCDRAYFGAIQAQLEAGGYGAMLHDLLNYDLSKFDITKIPDTRARVEQKLNSLKGCKAWLLDALEQGAIGGHGERVGWTSTGLLIDKDAAYASYVEFSKMQREYKPAKKAQWSKEVHQVLGETLSTARPRRGLGERPRQLQFRSLEECRSAFAKHVGSDLVSWEDDDA